MLLMTCEFFLLQEKKTKRNPVMYKYLCIRISLLHTLHTSTDDADRSYGRKNYQQTDLGTNLVMSLSKNSHKELYYEKIIRNTLTSLCRDLWWTVIVYCK